MATLTVFELSSSGRDPTADMVPCGAGGDEFVNTGKEFVLIHHATSFRTVTFQTYPTYDGLALGSLIKVRLDELGFSIIGPFPPFIYNDAVTNGKVQMTYDVTTATSVLIYRVSQA